VHVPLFSCSSCKVEKKFIKILVWKFLNAVICWSDRTGGEDERYMEVTQEQIQRLGLLVVVIENVPRFEDDE
jgi:hypothetical protein